MTIDSAQGERQPIHGQVDFAMMYAAHDAFTRHLERLASSVGHGRDGAAQLHAGWLMFKGQLHIHHTAEDTSLWPKLRAAVQHPDEVAILDAMEHEHADLDPGIERVDAAFAAADPTVLAEVVQGLVAGLGRHMRHEETAALPLIETYLGPEGWAAFTRDIRKTQGVRGAAVYLPWLFDGAPPDAAAKLLAALPAPVRLLYRRVWVPRYRRALGR
jgi:iron-sulfur cluster repair protein YtfE (RIC family)